MEDFHVHLRAWLLLVAIAVVVVAGAWYDTRRRRPGDTRGWKPAEAAVVDRCVVSRDAVAYCRLTVRFRTWRGHWAHLVAEVPAAHAPPEARVWVLYDPLRPHYARLSLQQPCDE